MKDYWQVLGIEKDATRDEIKKAYRYYASKFHPDKHNNDEFFKDRFQEINEAYNFLINQDSSENNSIEDNNQETRDRNYFELALQFYDSDNLEEAYTYVRKALAINPLVGDYFYLEALIHRCYLDPVNALKSVEKGMDLGCENCKNMVYELKSIKEKALKRRTRIAEDLVWVPMIVIFVSSFVPSGLYCLLLGGIGATVSLIRLSLLGKPLGEDLSFVRKDLFYQLYLFIDVFVPIFGACIVAIIRF